MASVEEILERNWLTNNGPCVRQFETEVADYLGVKHCIAVCNGTIALEIVIRALGLSGEVIVPSFTFVATAHALQWQQITPVFCDIDPGTHNLDPDRIEEMITPRTKAILGVHLWGEPCAIDALTEIAERRGLKLMFDASHAFGNTFRGKRIGHFGAAEVFSFHATKFIHAIEGGAIATNDDSLAERAKLMRNFGFSGYDNVVFIGTNGKMNEFSAAMGSHTLGSIDDITRRNRANFKEFASGLRDIPGISLREPQAAGERNYQYVVIDVEDAAFGLCRDVLVKILHAENIIARRYFFPGCHRVEPYRSLYPNAGLMLPETNRVAARVVCLPTGSAMEIEDVRQVCGVIRRAHDEADRIRR